MKKFYCLSACLWVCSMMSVAQSVLNIPFGMSYNYVKNTLVNRLGESKVLEHKENILISDFYMGDIKFDYGKFEFQRDAKESYFSRAYFEIRLSLNEIDAAARIRDHLFEQYIKDKYADDYINSYINKQNFKCYTFGIDPKDNNKALAVLAISKSKGKDGIMRLYLTLDYGPIFYLNNANDF